MQINLDIMRLAGVLALSANAAVCLGQGAAASSLVDQAQRRVVAYVGRLADLHCTESVLQEKLGDNGHAVASERAQYDYLTMIGGDRDGLQLNESRIEASASKRKPLPMLVTNGFSTLMLIFHPYYRDSYRFEPGAEQTIDGRAAVPIHFEQLNGHRSPAALALRGREYPLALTGTAWIDKQSGEVVSMDAGLDRDMSDIGLRTLAIHVEYKVSDLGKNVGPVMLPALAVVDVTTPRQRWRNTHRFSAYKSFSTEAEQDPNVKVIPEKPAQPAGDATPSEPNPKEKP